MPTATKTKPTLRCLECDKRITRAQIDLAARYGVTPRYCSTKCRKTSAQRRYRAKQKIALN